MASALTLESGLGQMGREMLEGEGEGTKTNGGGRRKLTGGPTLGLPPEPSGVVAERRTAGYDGSLAITLHCGLSWLLFQPWSPQ